jgi:hypothetical protein
MKQLFYTSCRAGFSVSGNSGFQVRAVSPSMTADEVRAAVPYASYALPSDVRPDEDTRHTAPVRLAFLDTPNLGRVICHAQYVGQDPTTKRFGNFFSHVLVDLPAEVDVRAVIQTWGAGFWRRDDDDGPAELPEISDLPPEGILDGSILESFLADESHRELVEYVMTCILRGGEDQRIIVAASAEKLALCVYAVTLALPSTLLDRFSFSTYESEPLTCPARLVGTSWGDPENRDLPSSCYSGGCLGYNTFSGRKTDMDSRVGYAQYAVRALTNEESHSEIDSFRKAAQKNDIRTGALLDLFYRFCSARGIQDFTQDDCVQLMQHQKVSISCLKRGAKSAGLLEKIVQYANHSAEFYDLVVPLTVDRINRLQLDVTGTPAIPPAVGGQLKNWIALEGFRKSPNVFSSNLGAIGEALGEQPAAFRKKFINEIKSDICRTLFVRSDGSPVNAALRSVLNTIGLADGDPVGLFRLIVREYATGPKKFWRSRNLAAALAEVACSPDIGSRLNQSEVQDVIRMIRTYGGGTVIKAVTARSKRWTVKTQEKWHRLTWSPAPYLLLGGLTAAFILALLLLLLDELVLHRINIGERIQNLVTQPTEEDF